MELSDELPTPFSLEKLLSEQGSDPFCQTALSGQSHTKDLAFFEDDQDGLLRRKPKFLARRVQIVVPGTLRPSLPMFAHSNRFAGSPCTKTHIFQGVKNVLQATDGRGRRRGSLKLPFVHAQPSEAPETLESFEVVPCYATPRSGRDRHPGSAPKNS